MASLASEFVGLLRCPITGQRLSEAPESELRRFPVFESFRPMAQCWLLRADGRMLYPVRNGLPVLLKEEGVGLSGATDRVDPADVG